MNVSTFTFGALAIVVGVILFRVKYEVVALEMQSASIDKKTYETQDAIHHLKAEWAHLNDPKRIKDLSKKFLDNIQPLQNNQMVTFHDAAGGDNSDYPKVLEDWIDAASKENVYQEGAD